MVKKCNASAKRWELFSGNREFYSGNVTMMPHGTCNLGVTCIHSFLWVWMFAWTTSLSAMVFPITMVPGSMMGRPWSPASGGEWTFVLWSFSQCHQLPETFSAFPCHLFLLIYTHQKSKCDSHCFQSIHWLSLWSSTTAQALLLAFG